MACNALPRISSASAPAMRKHVSISKNKKAERKSKVAAVPASLDLAELRRSTDELGSSPPTAFSVRVDALRERLLALPCGTCKEWLFLAWSKWSAHAADVASRPWFADLSRLVDLTAPLRLVEGAACYPCFSKFCPALFISCLVPFVFTSRAPACWVSLQ